MRQGYQGVAIAVPVTIPYVRYSIRAAHWWLARSLSEIISRSGLKKDEIDGLSVSSLTLAPDTAIGLTQHLGLSPRWLDHVPFGGASGVVALRRAARAVQAGDADVVACLGVEAGDVLRIAAGQKQVQQIFLDRHMMLLFSSLWPHTRFLTVPSFCHFLNWPKDAHIGLRALNWPQNLNLGNAPHSH
jgi:acetyl-CoA acetyltransferase